MRRRCYAIFATDHKGELLGYIENSFSMGWAANRVRIWRASRDRIKYRFDSKPASLMSTVATLQRNNPTWDVFCVRIGSKNSPVNINWELFHQGRKAKLGNIGKYEWRNLKFVKKVNARAHPAE